MRLTFLSPKKTYLSLSRRLLVWIAGIFTALATVTTGLQLALQYSLEQTSGARQIAFTLYSTRDVLANALWSFDSVQLSATADLLYEHPLLQAVNVSSEDVSLNESRGEAREWTGEPRPFMLDDYPDLKIESMGRLFNKHLRFTLDITFQSNDLVYPVGQVIAYSNVGLILEKSRANLIYTALSALLLCAILVAVTAWSVHRLVARRLNLMQREISTIEPEDDVFRARLLPGWLTRERDEIALLTETLNRLQVQLADKSLRIRQHQQNLEEQIQARTRELENTLAELKISNAHKNEFLANMSHEIRTPMNGIIGMAELLQDSRLDNRQREYLNTILNSGHTLTTIINDILDLSKIEAGKLELESIEFNLPALIDETLKLFIKPAEEKNLFVAADYDAKAPDKVVGDPTRIRQLLLNLLGNAFKFTKSGSILVRVRYLNQRQGLRFEIQDTGAGVEPSLQASLFDAFSQGGSSTSRQYGGTGLGLAICKRLVELMQGEIGVDSAPDRGSTFWFTLPLPMHSSTEDGMTTLAGKCILLVSDQDAFNDLFIHQANHRDLQVDTATSIAEAESRLGQCRYQAVLIARELAKGQGLQAGQQLRRHPEEKVRVLMTTMTAAPTAGQLASHGFDCMVESPLSPRRILLRIATWFSSGKTHPKTQGRPSQPERSTPTLPCARLLVVEDNKVNQKVAEGLLHKLGMEVLIAENGEQALSMLQTTAVDLILMDCEMPTMDGYAASKAIRSLSDPKLRAIPIIGLSAHAMLEHQQTALDAGMNDYLTKPLRHQALKTALERWLSQPQASDQ